MAWSAPFARVLVAGTMLFGAAACGGGDKAEDEAVPDATSESTPEASSSAGPGAQAGSTSAPMGELPSAPPMPKIASEDSAAGAQAFARHWIDLANVASLTGDTDELNELSASSCASCTSFIERVDTVYKGGGHLMGGEIAIAATTADQAKKDKATPVTVKVTISAQESMAATGEIVQRYGADKHNFVFALEHRGGSWLVTDLKIESVS